MTIEKDIIDKYPHSSRVNNKSNHLKIPNQYDTVINLNFKKYPKVPKVKLERNDGKTFNLNVIISSLRNWNKNQPPTILELIDEITLAINNLISNKILIKKDLIAGLMEMCRTRHPEKVTGILGVDKEIVSEYILPSGACTDPTKSREVWGTKSCAIPLNFSYQGTFISRPKGDLSKNEKLEEVFKRRRFTLLIGFPYDSIESFKCFDNKGKILELSIVE